MIRASLTGSPLLGFNRNPFSREDEITSASLSVTSLSLSGGLPRRPTAASRRFFLALAGIGVLSLLGCGSHAKGDSAEAANEPIAECEAFAAAYEHCLGTLGPDRIAKARAEQTRAGLLTQARQGEAARAVLRTQCSANLAQINATCR